MNSARAIYVVVFDGFADWEPAYALAELRRWGKRTVCTVGFTCAPVTSMGGLQITPDLELSAVRASGVELLILPGGSLGKRCVPEAGPRIAARRAGGPRHARSSDLGGHVGARPSATAG